MKNLNIEKATMPNAVKTVNMKFLYSLCAALFLLTSSLSTKAQTTGSGTYDDPYEFVWDVSDYDGSLYYYNSFYNDQSGMSNNWGASNSGNDCWIKLTITTTSTLTVFSGTTSGYDPYDNAIHLVNSTRSYDLEYNDDNPAAYGSSYPLSGAISYTVSPGVYYIVLDGTDKPDVYPNPNHVRNGGVSMAFEIH
ncbi:hypothetical protein [Mucilaginibacter antarcticus]|uniref:Uncharacterized protein n=1 Tax=Mucilaginibacter antarcticus TaxID=1855725 RepID=A0ABW5XU29_9SPHI